MTKLPNPGLEAGIAPMLQEEGEDISLSVRRCVAEVLDLPVETVFDDASLIALGADSFHFVDLVFRLEREFTVTLDRRYALPDDHTVKTFITAVAKGVAATQQRVS